ncbi:hypothetical protein N9N67_00690 [Bacteriovoracaceae bacterium]|nr:hypothetical protein [Bacteriovoracaceae bacterium]
MEQRFQLFIFFIVVSIIGVSAYQFKDVFFGGEIPNRYSDPTKRVSQKSKKKSVLKNLAKFVKEKRLSNEAYAKKRKKVGSKMLKKTFSYSSNELDFNTSENINRRVNSMTKKPGHEMSHKKVPKLSKHKINIEFCLSKSNCLSPHELIELDDKQKLQALIDRRFGSCRLGGRSPDGHTKTCDHCSCSGYIINPRLFKNKLYGYGTAMAPNGKIIDQGSNGCLMKRDWRQTAIERINNCLNDPDGVCDCFHNNLN